MEPKAFSAWSDRRRRALEFAGELALAQATLEEAQDRYDDASARLRRALAASGTPADPEQSFGLLMQTAERLEATEIEATQRRRDLSVKVTAAEIS